MEDKKECYIAKVNEKAQVWLGLKENKYYVVSPFGEEWLVFDHGSYKATAKTSYFDITSFQPFKWNNYKIGDRVKFSVYSDDGYQHFLYGKVEDITFEYIYYVGRYIYLVKIEDSDELYGMTESTLSPV